MTNVFLSVGRTYTADQQEFLAAFEAHLRHNGLQPQTIGRTVVRNKAPLLAVMECMQDCEGTIVLAFERLHISSGAEKRGSAEQVVLTDVNLPTVWNQIEATMAYTLGKPLLMLVEPGLRSEGLLEHGHDWYVKPTRLTNALFSDAEFMGLLADWKKSIEKPRGSAPPASAGADWGQTSIGDILKALKPAQFWAMLGAVAALLGGAFSLGAWLAR